MNRGLFFLTAVLILAADAVTKWLVVTNMQMYESHNIVGDYIRLTYIHNSGAAFGMFQGSRWPLVIVSLAAISVVTGIALRTGTRRATALTLGLILGGAVGNLVDRLRLGEVIDFINVGIGPHRWPVFNVADSAVTVGVVFLAIQLALQDRRDGSATAETSDSSSEAGDAGMASPSRGV